QQLAAPTAPERRQGGYRAARNGGRRSGKRGFNSSWHSPHMVSNYVAERAITPVQRGKMRQDTPPAKPFKKTI
ncbi:MAG TPA: hypothetical protein VLC12_09540, partial [Terriglobales bacterium]|nr:hypothetical protein [Terriglobales bacterium]